MGSFFACIFELTRRKNASTKLLYLVITLGSSLVVFCSTFAPERKKKCDDIIFVKYIVDYLLNISLYSFIWTFNRRRVKQKTCEAQFIMLKLTI